MKRSSFIIRTLWLLVVVVLFQGCLLFPPSDLIQLTPDEFAEVILNKDVFLVDVHIPEQQHLPYTDLFLPYNEVGKHLDEFPADKNTPIYMFCKTGHMVYVSARTLYKHGYTAIYNLDGGTVAWEDAGYGYDVSQ